MDPPTAQLVPKTEPVAVNEAVFTEDVRIKIRSYRTRWGGGSSTYTSGRAVGR